MEIKIESLLAGAKKAEGAVVVISVFHAFTTTAVAFEQGAERVILTPETDDAILLRKQGQGSLCMGSVDGKKPEDFDFAESPHAISQLDLKGKTGILSSRSGTMGVNAAWRAETIYGTALVNMAATVLALQQAKPKLINIVPMGINGRTRTDEDEIAAIYLKNLLEGHHPDPVAMTSLLRSCHAAQKHLDPARPGDTCEDLEIALQVDRVPFAIEVGRRDRMLVASPVMKKEVQPV